MLEAVPNVSEGRDAQVIRAISLAFARRPPTFRGRNGWALCDVHADPDHNRSVFTIVAVDDQRLVASLLAGIGVAVESIDLREHEGVHPRVGVADVVPLVPLVPADMPRAIAAAQEAARRIGTELGLPVFLYGEAGEGRRPAFFRRGGLDELTRRIEAGELVPDEGPARVDPRSGAVLVGAREPLVAYNLELESGDLAVAKEIAAAVRESGGGMPGVQAIGLLLASSGRAQVSMNVIDIERAPLHEVVRRVQAEARARGVKVRAGELVGLIPERVVRAAAAAGVELPGVDEWQVLEDVLRSRLAE